MLVDLLIKIYLSGILVTLVLITCFPALLYTKVKLAEFKKARDKSPLSPLLEAVARTVAVTIVAVAWPVWLVTRLIRKLGVKK